MANIIPATPRGGWKQPNTNAQRSDASNVDTGRPGIGAGARLQSGSSDPVTRVNPATGRVDNSSTTRIFTPELGRTEQQDGGGSNTTTANRVTPAGVVSPGNGTPMLGVSDTGTLANYDGSGVDTGGARVSGGHVVDGKTLP